MLAESSQAGGHNPPEDFQPPPGPRRPRRRRREVTPRQAAAAYRSAFPPHTPDNDLNYSRPRAWRNAKRAFGVGQLAGVRGEGGEPGRAMVRLEREMPGGDVRFLLAVAVHAFLSMDMRGRGRACVAYDFWCDEQRKNRSAAAGEGTVSHA